MNIKIYITYHKKMHPISSAIMQPVQTGCAVAKEIFDGMLRDDAGENISAENKRYCELTAQYWVWKNCEREGSPEYVGFMHWRRHFMFDDWQGNPNALWLPGSAMYAVPCITPEYMAHLRDELIERRVTGQDCVVLKPYDVKNLGMVNVREQYCRLSGQRKEWYDLFLTTVRRLYPEYADDVTKLENGSVQYLCNMFIMRQELFREYSEFCFRVLEEMDKQVDSSRLDMRAKRFLGYLGEFCLTLYIFHAQTLHRRILELNGSFILADKPPRLARLRLSYYKFMSHITSGERRCRYIRRCARIRDIITAERALREKDVNDHT